MSNQEFECNQKKRCDSFYKKAFENRKKYIENLEDENGELQQRIDKAIKFISEDLFYCLASSDDITIYIDKLLKILKGEQE